MVIIVVIKVVASFPIKVVNKVVFKVVTSVVINVATRVVIIMVIKPLVMSLPHYFKLEKLPRLLTVEWL